MFFSSSRWELLGAEQDRCEAHFFLFNGSYRLGDKKKTQSMERGKMDGIASDRGGDEEEEEKEKERKKGSPPTGSPTSPRAEQKPLLRLRT